MPALLSRPRERWKRLESDLRVNTGAVRVNGESFSELATLGATRGLLWDRTSTERHPRRRTEVEVGIAAGAPRPACAEVEAP